MRSFYQDRLGTNIRKTQKKTRFCRDAERSRAADSPAASMQAARASVAPRLRATTALIRRALSSATSGSRSTTASSSRQDIPDLNLCQTLTDCQNFDRDRGPSTSKSGMLQVATLRRLWSWDSCSHVTVHYIDWCDRNQQPVAR